MWKYQQTDELYCNNLHIMHSDIYLGMDFSDGIRHWKYIKREELPNGKFRYYYDDNNELEKMEESISKMKEYSNKSYLAEQFDINEKKANYIGKKYAINRKYKNGRPFLFGKRKYDKSINELNKMQSDIEKAEKDYDNKTKKRDKYIDEGLNAFEKYRKVKTRSSN